MMRAADVLSNSGITKEAKPVAQAFFPVLLIVVKSIFTPSKNMNNELPMKAIV